MARKLLIRTLALLLALALAALAAEVLLRLPLFERPAMRSTAVIEHRRPTPRHLPDFRGAEPGPRRPGTYRVVVVGDSFTWGDGVYAQDAYPARLERRLSELSSTVEFEVISWSRPGWNTDWAWRSVGPELDRLAPDLLILGYCINDAEPSAEQELDRLRRKMGVEPPSAASADRPRSRLIQVIASAVGNVTSRARLSAYYHQLYADGPGWKRTRRSLKQMAAAARKRRIRHLAVIFPIFDSQLDSAYRYRDLHRMAAEQAAASGFEVLDLLPFYRGIDARRLAVVPFTDAHPNELAHRIAADRIVDFLIEKRWVPADGDQLWRVRKSRELMGDAPTSSDDQPPRSDP